MMYFIFCLLPAAGSARRTALPVLFYSQANFWFFCPQGQHVAPIKVKFGREVSSVTNFTLIGSGVWVYGPKTLQNCNFTDIIAPKGRVPCMILTKFTGFLHVLSLHKYVKFGCFISTNDKIINNLRRWGRF